MQKFANLHDISIELNFQKQKKQKNAQSYFFNTVSKQQARISFRIFPTNLLVDIAIFKILLAIQTHHQNETIYDWIGFTNYENRWLEKRITVGSPPFHFWWLF